jgi:hypothetical protein
VDTEYVGEGSHAKGVDEGDVGIDAEDVNEAPRAEVLVEASCCSRRR